MGVAEGEVQTIWDNSLILQGFLKSTLSHAVIEILFCCLIAPKILFYLLNGCLTINSFLLSSETNGESVELIFEKELFYRLLGLTVSIFLSMIFPICKIFNIQISLRTTFKKISSEKYVLNWVGIPPSEKKSDNFLSELSPEDRRVL